MDKVSMTLKNWRWWVGLVPLALVILATAFSSLLMVAGLAAEWVMDHALSPAARGLREWVQRRKAGEK